MSIRDILFSTGASSQAETQKLMGAAERQAEALLNHGHLGAKPGDFVNVAATPIVKPSRPGDTPPRQFVGKTLETLHKTLESYKTERGLLADDIAKLTEELRQLDAAIEAVQVAYNTLSPPEELAMEKSLNEAVANAAAAEALAKEFPYSPSPIANA